MKLPVKLARYRARRFSCIFFICGRTGHVVYVGKSANFDTHGERLHRHLFVLPCPPRRLEKLNRELVWLFQPAWNTAHNPKGKRAYRSPFGKKIVDRKKAIRNLSEKEKL